MRNSSFKLQTSISTLTYSYLISVHLISRGKQATQSSEAFLGPAFAAVDGIYKQDHDAGVCSHTNGEKNPWWSLDLGSQHYVHSVKIWNRADCCGRRLSSLQIQVSDNNEEWRDVGGLNEQAANGGIYTIILHTFGQYVRLILSADAKVHLTLCEVEIYGNDLKDALVSRHKPATQSSTHLNFAANIATDGIYNQTLWTHTNAEINPWWQINLNRVHYVYQVKIWNRGDCCGERLTSVKIQSSLDGVHFNDIGAWLGCAVTGGIYALNVQTYGRFFRLVMPKNESAVLSLTEVEIYGNPLKNLGPMPGGWSYCGPMDEPARLVFNAVMKKIKEEVNQNLSDSNVICVQTQVVAGVNYQFQIKLINGYSYARVYQPLTGPPELVAYDPIAQ